MKSPWIFSCRNSTNSDGWSVPKLSLSPETLMYVFPDEITNWCPSLSPFKTITEAPDCERLITCGRPGGNALPKGSTMGMGALCGPANTTGAIVAIADTLAAGARGARFGGAVGEAVAGGGVGACS